MDIDAFLKKLKVKDVNYCLDKIKHYNETSSTSIPSTDSLKLLPNLPDAENEMSILMHTIFTGNLNLVEELLKPFIKNEQILTKIVNFTIHKHNYTPLMMAVITGKIEIVKLLMQCGADKAAKNKVDKTAIDLAAFTGVPEIAAFLSNYYDMSEIDYDTKMLLSETNLAPANIALNHMKNVNLDVLMDIYHKEPFPTNAKAAYFYNLIKQIQNCEYIYDTNDTQTPKVLSIPNQKQLTNYIKLHAISSNVHSAKPFQHQEICKVLTKISEKNIEFKNWLEEINKFSENSFQDSALKTLENLVCNINMRKQENRCDLCCKPNAKKCCSKCKIRYCSKYCQKLSWFDHKKWCLGIQHLESAENEENNKNGPQSNMIPGKGKLDVNEIENSLKEL